MKNILVLPLSLITFVLISLSYGCYDEEDPCQNSPNIPSINHFWTLDEGREIQQNGYYINYPDGLVITSVDTNSYVPGDQGWFDALTYEFGSEGDTIFVENCGTSDAPTYHVLASYLERIYTFGDSLDVRSDNFAISNIAVVEDLLDEPEIQVTTGEGNSFPIILTALTSTNLTLTSYFQDTFSYSWDPLNDTIYWSSFEEERRFTR